MNDEAKRKIEVLLKEYDTCRQEILGRIGNRFNILALLGGLVGIVGAKKSDVNWPIVWIAIMILLMVWVWLGLLLHQLSKNVQDLEGRINEIAEEKLLRWESERASPLFKNTISYLMGGLNRLRRVVNCCKRTK